jgi:hypothetical protein
VRLTLSVSGFVKIWSKTGEKFDEAPLQILIWVWRPLEHLPNTAGAAADAAAYLRHARLLGRPPARGHRRGASREKRGRRRKRQRRPRRRRRRDWRRGGARAGRRAARTGARGAGGAAAAPPLRGRRRGVRVRGVPRGAAAAEAPLAVRQVRGRPRHHAARARGDGGAAALGASARQPTTTSPPHPRRVTSARRPARQAHELLLGCGCEDGCWCCCHSSKCPEYNMCCSRRGALALLERMRRPQPSHVAGDRDVDGCVAARDDAAPAPPPGDQDDSMLGRSIARMRGIARLGPDAMPWPRE